MQLAEIAETVLFQEWSVAPRRRRIISDLIFSFFCIKTKGQRKANRKIVQIALIVCVMHLIDGKKPCTQFFLLNNHLSFDFYNFIFYRRDSFVEY